MPLAFLIQKKETKRKKRNRNRELYKREIKNYKKRKKVVGILKYEERQTERDRD